MSMMRMVVCLSMLLWAAPAWATDYYISPTGNNANPGTQALPWLTFAHALNTGMAGTGSAKGCGHTLNLLNGTYGSGTNTGQIVFTARTCSAAAPLTIKALNERQARIHAATGTKAIYLEGNGGIAYINFEGLYLTSDAPAGLMFYCEHGANHLTFKRSIVRQLTGNDQSLHPIIMSTCHFNLFEDVEILRYTHHGIQNGGGSNNNIFRRIYCNRQTVTASAGNGGNCIAIYPGDRNILENVLVEQQTGVQGFGGIVELNADGAGLDNSIVGSVLYNGTGTCVSINARQNAVATGMPRNTTVRDVACVNHRSAGEAFLNASTKNTVIQRVSIFGTSASGSDAMTAKLGGFTGDGFYSSFVSDSLVMNTVIGFQFTAAIDSWTGQRLRTFNVTGTSYFPATSDARWTNVSSSINPTMGSCKLWVPTGSPLKGAGAGGADIGATILYRYNTPIGTTTPVLTTTPLWDPTTGAFPRGALVAGVNDVAGQNLFDFHTRVNVGAANGCAFPAGYGGAAPPPDTTPPGVPPNVIVSQAERPHGQ